MTISGAIWDGNETAFGSVTTFCSHKRTTAKRLLYSTLLAFSNVRDHQQNKRNNQEGKCTQSSIFAKVSSESTTMKNTLNSSIEAKGISFSGFLHSLFWAAPWGWKAL